MGYPWTRAGTAIREPELGLGLGLGLSPFFWDSPGFLYAKFPPKRWHSIEAQGLGVAVGLGLGLSSFFTGKATAMPTKTKITKH